MAVGEKGDEEAVDEGILADEDTGNFFFEGVNPFVLLGDFVLELVGGHEGDFRCSV